MSEDVIVNSPEGESSEPENPGISVEQEARSQGWVGKEEFRGNEDEWVDAETFVKRGKEILPVLRKNNEKLLQRLAKAEKDAEEARNVARDFQKFQKETYERKAQSYEAEIAQLKQAKKEALSQGDGDRAVEIDDKIDNLKEEVTAAKAEATKAATPPPSLNPELNSWLEKNEWFGTDKRLTGVANGIGEALRAENPALQGQAFLDKLDEELAPYLAPKTKEIGRAHV